jgi:hypothetical protein
MSPETIASNALFRHFVEIYTDLLTALSNANYLQCQPHGFASATMVAQTPFIEAPCSMVYNPLLSQEVGGFPLT